MYLPRALQAVLTGLALVLALPPVAAAQAPAPAAAKLPADPWPRDVSLSNAAVLVYQPQVNKWVDNQIDFRCALAIKPTGAKEETFGVVFATARTQVDKVARTVVFENLKITKSDFPTLPNHGAAYAAELQKQFAASMRSISLDRLEASLALAGVKPPTVAVNNAPPQVLVSYSPAILVPIDGAPVLKPVPGHSRVQRVINTRALILKGGWATISTCTYTTAGSRPLRSADPGRRRALDPSKRRLPGKSRNPSPRRARSTCSTAVPRPTQSRRLPTVFRRSTRARFPRNSSCSRASRISSRSWARRSCGRRTRRATS